MGGRCGSAGWPVSLLLLGAALLLAALLAVLLLYLPPLLATESTADRKNPLLRRRGRGPARLLLDTDAGVDDAFALLLALGSPGVSLEAVTCVHGNTAVHNVCANVLKVLHAARRLDVAVFAGAAHPLGAPPPPMEPYFGADGFGDAQLGPDAAPDPARHLRPGLAADALTELARQQPGQLSLLCLGPLTNVALAAQKDPDFLSNLKEVVVLGGSVEGIGNTKPGVEFNFYMDPEAANFVFESNTSSSSETKPITLIPWETIYSRNHITMDWRKNVLGMVESPQVMLLNKAECLENMALWVSGDPMAAAALLYPELVTVHGQYKMAVEVAGQHGRGAAFVDYSGSLTPRNVIIAQEFDVELYKSLLVETLK